MASKTKLFVTLGAVLTAFIGAGLYFLPDWDIPALAIVSPMRSIASSDTKQPNIILWGDSPSFPVDKAIRIDVAHSLPHARKTGIPITNVTDFVNREIDQHGSVWVVVSYASNEKIGNVVTVLNACRNTRTAGIALNQIGAAYVDQRYSK